MIRPLPSVVEGPRRAKTLLALALLIVFGVGTWGMARSGGTRSLPEQGAQASASAAKVRGRNLSLQPAALGLGRKLGQRFLKAGREVTVLEGTITTDTGGRYIIVRRVQDEGGERVEITVAGSGAPLTWDAGGTSQTGHQAAAGASALAERLVLDSPDQFVLAQLRGAPYTVVARGVRADEGGGESYSGPLHDVVRVGEPSRVEGAVPAWRLYYLNRGTGLLDRVISEEGGERVEAVLSGWAEHAGEWQPARVTWSRRGQVFMALAVTNVAHGPRQ
jgi:hypothetical protein